MIRPALLALALFGCAVEDDLEPRDVENSLHASDELTMGVDPPGCIVGEYGCACFDPGQLCADGLTCNGWTCGCDFLGTLSCPCNAGDCDGDLVCDDLGFCQ